MRAKTQILLLIASKCNYHLRYPDFKVYSTKRQDLQVCLSRGRDTLNLKFDHSSHLHLKVCSRIWTIYVQQAFYKATLWNEDNSYANLTATARGA